jgi:putative ABC transport system permease protein
MVISVLERRTEVGLRRALGATRRQVGVQFLAESLVLSVLGGLAGIGLGALATVVYAITAAQSPIVPLSAVGAGLGVAVSVGLLAGAYPALRAARLAPADALRTS